MILSSLLWQIWTAPIWIVQEVRPHGLSSYSTRYVLNYLNGKKLTGQHLLQINPLEIRKELLNYPLLKEVRVERRLFPALVNIFITERKPAFRLFYEPPGQQAYTTEQSGLLDEEGLILNIPDTHTPPHTILTSLERKKLKKGQLQPEQLTLLHQLNGLYQKKQLPIQGIYNISNPENIILRTPEINAPIWLGKPENLSLKLGLLVPLNDIIVKQNRPIACIDLRFWKHPVIRTQSSG